MSEIPRLKITDAVDGEVRLLEIVPAGALRTAPDAIYSLAGVDGRNAELEGLVVLRRGEALVMTVDGEPLVTLEGFFAPVASARLRVVDDGAPSGVWTVDSRDADALPDEDEDDRAGAVLWPLTSSPATLAAEAELADALTDGSGPVDGRAGGADAAASAVADGAAGGSGPEEAGAGLSPEAKLGVGIALGAGALAALGSSSGGGGASARDAGAPTIGAGEAATRRFVAEGETFVVDLEADEPVSWSIVDGELDAQAFRIDADGVLGFLVAPELDADPGAPDEYAVQVRATDADGEVAVQRIDVSVLEAGAFGAAEGGDAGGSGEGAGPGASPAGASAVGEGTDTPLRFLEQEGASHWTLSGDDADAFTLREDDDDPSGTARLSFDRRDLPSVAAPRDADGDNVYEVEAQAWDGDPLAGGTPAGAPRAFAFEVVERDVPLGIDENDSLVALRYTYFDEPFGSETLSIVGGDDAARFAIDAEGNLAFLDAPDFEAPLDADGDNVYEVRLSTGQREGTAHVRVRDVEEGGSRPLEDGGAARPGAPDAAVDDLLAAPAAAFVPLDPIAPWVHEFH